MAVDPMLFPFDRHGPARPLSPVILSVPHAGRWYLASLVAQLRASPAQLSGLEDRHVDQVAHAGRGAETMFVARLPRAWIDINRDESDRDPLVEAERDRARQPHVSAKARAGLGLVPRRIGRFEMIWHRPLPATEIARRIALLHRPYHTAIGAALAAARARFGVAVLLDLHSMPPLAHPAAPPRVVLGDRNGASAALPVVDALWQVAAEAGLRPVRNVPYSGGHVLERHAAPARGIHAVQVELDRTLYLDPGLVHPAAGVAPLGAILRRMIAAAADAALAGRPQAMAAE